ncbi:MAG: HNH endonuclease [Lachnospiraceae bacterium]|nr:HNH endonuclease [Lachnospiraceae bacterium]
MYQYDRRNRLTAHTKGGVTSQYEYDNAGNLLKDDRARYEYDAFNRNTKVETFNGNIQINRYDAEGLRYEMEENGRLVSFIFRGDEVVAEESQEDRIRYIRTSVLLASDAESARTYYHYVSDEMSSVTHVIDGENEEILNRYEYDAWGNLTTCEEKVHNRFKFNGQQYDPVSQQYYLRARYYNPVIGRFTQEDSYNVDGLNLYAYCRNNPVYYVDPSGNICETAANKITDKLNNNQATRNEQKKLAAYLRNKDRNGGLTDAERSTLNKIEGYTFRNGNQAQLNARQKAVDDAARKKNINKKGMTRADLAQSKGFQGINATANGGADFSGSQYIYILDDGKSASVKIKLTGSRKGDYQAANMKLNLGSMDEAPIKGYVWHHVDDYDVRTGMATLQLVQIPAHEATKTHAGSVKQYEVDTGIKYK